MSDDPWSAFNPQPIATSSPQVGAADPWAAFKPRVVPAGTDAGANAAFSEGALDGVPIIGPALEKAGDYVGSHIGSWISGKPVDQVLAEGQAIKDATQRAHPAASTVGSLVGSAMALGPAMRIAPAAFGATPGALTAGKVAAGALTGGAIGGTDAAIRSDGDVGSTVLGAMGGAMGGAAGPVVGAVAGRVGEGVADALAQRGALRDINYPLDPVTGTRMRSPVQVSRPSMDVLTRAADSDGTLAGQGAANIAAAGPDAMLADAGPASQNVLDTALQRGGPGAVAARQAIEQRASGADQQLTTALDSTLGAPRGVQTATNGIRSSTAAARSDAYDAAYSAPIDYSSDAGQALEQMVRNRVPAGIIARANAQIRIDGDTSAQILARVGDDGSVTYERLPDVRQLDYITRSLRDVAQRGDGQGALGGNTSEGRSFGNLAQDIRGTLRQAVPEYGQALDTAAQPIQARNALEFGSSMLSPSVPRDVAAETVRGMTTPELQQVRQGVRSQIAETMANVKRTITDPNVDARQAMDLVKQMSSDAAQQKIGMIIKAPEQAALNQALLRATRSLELRASVAGNSRTAARLMTKEGVEAAAAPGPIQKLSAGEPLKAGKAVAQFLTKTRPSDITAREDAIYGELANVLTGPRGPDATGLLSRLQQAQQTRGATNGFARRLPYGPVASTGILSLLPLLNKRAQ